MYGGLERHFLTICTFHRTQGFREDPIVEGMLTQLRQRAVDHQFAIHAYCFMPSEVHLLLEGLSRRSELRRFVRDWKRWTTFSYRGTTGGELWQRGHVEQVLHPDEQTDVVMRYVLATPVRAGLVANVNDYRYVGSDTSAMCDVLSGVMETGTREGTPGDYARAGSAHEAPDAHGEPLESRTSYADTRSLAGPGGTPVR